MTALLEEKPVQLRLPVVTCSYCYGIGTLEATDIFCGAGGSSLGLEAVSCPMCGRQLIEVTQALNHWDLAVLAHNSNFPNADHDVHSVQAVQPSRFRRTPLLWASPECTHHAYCRGTKANSPEALRSRATFGDIVRFTEFHRYDAVIVENVIEARLWCGVAAHDEPDGTNKCSCATSFNRWYRDMRALGYDSKIVYFNSQFALPTPQSRDRMYVVFWRKGLPAPALDFRPASWCSTCEEIVQGIQTWKRPSKGSVREKVPEWGRYGPQYLYSCPTCSSSVAPAVVGARSAIDFSIKSQRIGDRDKDLAPKTRERIKAGLRRLQTLDPMVVQVGGHLYERRPGVRVWSVNDPLRTVVGTPNVFAVVDPKANSAGMVLQKSTNGTGRGLLEPVPAVTASSGDHMVVLRYGGQSANPRAIGEPMGTLTAHDREVGLLVPNREGARGGSVKEPAGTVVGHSQHMLLVPNREHARGGSGDEPAATVTTAPKQHMLVQVNRSTKRNGKTVAVDRQAGAMGEPMRTVAGHGELGVVSLRNHGGTVSGGEPVETVVGGGNHHGVLLYNGERAESRDLGEPTGTITARDKQSLVMPYNRTGVAHPDGVPMGTLTSKDREALVEVTDDDVDNCDFRMLQWPELLRAQAPFDHVDGRPYLLEANRRNERGKVLTLANEQKVKMIGNMVSSPVATMLGYALVDTLVA
ncbi:MAG TPA: DNA cytosine methyltransferase [Gaiellaceae bacterium]|nr:DNA cytosine methyltransferase [Gaiellaceae bacterium]